MKDEIKEILDKLKSDNYPFGIATIDINKLLDYITNLQEELKSANESISWWSNRFKAVERDNERLKEWKEDLLKENIELENIRKKAIEYIKSLEEDSTDYDGEVIIGEIGTHCKDKLLNILNGGDEE